MNVSVHCTFGNLSNHKIEAPLNIVNMHQLLFVTKMKFKKTSYGNTTIILSETKFMKLFHSPELSFCKHSLLILKFAPKSFIFWVWVKDIWPVCTLKRWCNVRIISIRHLKKCWLHKKLKFHPGNTKDILVLVIYFSRLLLTSSQGYFCPELISMLSYLLHAFVNVFLHALNRRQENQEAQSRTRINTVLTLKQIHEFPFKLVQICYCKILDRVPLVRSYLIELQDNNCTNHTAHYN